MTRVRVVEITAIDEYSRIPKIYVHFKGLPLGFGLNNKRLPDNISPAFTLADVRGYEPEKKLSEYREFGPQGLVLGMEVRCKVDDRVPQGVISDVHPRLRSREA